MSFLRLRPVGEGFRSLACHSGATTPPPGTHAATRPAMISPRWPSSSPSSPPPQAPVSFTSQGRADRISPRPSASPRPRAATTNSLGVALLGYHQPRTWSARPNLVPRLGFQRGMRLPRRRPALTRTYVPTYDDHVAHLGDGRRHRTSHSGLVSGEHPGQLRILGIVAALVAVALVDQSGPWARPTPSRSSSRSALAST